MLQSIFLKSAIYMKPNLDPQNTMLISTQNMYNQKKFYVSPKKGVKRSVDCWVEPWNKNKSENPLTQ